MNTNEQKSTAIPARRVNLGGTAGEKGEYTPAATDTGTPVVDPGNDAKRKRIEQLAKAREAKRARNTVAVVKETPPEPEPENDTEDPADDLASDDDLDPPPTPIRDTVLISPKKRKALADALLGGHEPENDREEPPKKKHRTTAEIPTNNSLRNMVLDKAIDIGRLAVASGVCSVILVAVKAAAGGQIQNQPTLNPEFFKY